jgi:hypothetical protein
MKYYLAMWDSQASADARADDNDANIYEGSMPMGALLLDLNEDTIKRVLDTAYKEEIVDMHDPDSPEAVPTGKWHKIHRSPLGDVVQYVWNNHATQVDELCVTIREATVI